MKIAIITDIHHSAESEPDFDVRPVVEAFVTRAIESGADALIDLGDRTDDADRETDLRLAGELADIFAAFRGPRVHLLGNHDVVNLTGEDHARLFGQGPESRVIDLDEGRIIVWQPSVKRNPATGFPPASDDLPWLLAALNSAARPAIIATHIPLSGASMAGNYYFENNADLATYPDHAAIRRAVEATGAASVWLAGHVHWNSFANIGGIYHLTLQSMSERFTTVPDPACTWGELVTTGATARLEVFGRDPLVIEMPFRVSVEHPWPQPRPRVPRS